jgi:hypothetical protein
MICWFYPASNDYKLARGVKQARLLRARFDRIFKRGRHPGARNSAVANLIRPGTA